MDRHADVRTPPTAAPGGLELPRDRRDWPLEARAALRELLRELDLWCRRRDWPATNNDWVAETAVRQAWAMDGSA